MKILIVTSEAVPFAKTGGLADAVPALAAALKSARHDVRIVMPRYYSIDKDSMDQLSSPLGVPMGGGEMWCGLFRTVLPGTEVPVYFLEREDLYGRAGLYGPDGSSSWPDNARRYAFLSTASFQLARYLDWIPDVLHLHDWQAAPAAWMLSAREKYRDFKNTVSVMTIHNLGYQGVFPASDLSVFDEDFVATAAAGGLMDNNLNFLASGIKHADRITTVSPTYAREILQPEYSEGLGWVLMERAHKIDGILNGMDYSEWNPATDTALAPDNYDRRSMNGKKQLKARLQQEMGLPVNPGIPLFGVVTRLTGQKGVDLFSDAGGPALEVFRSGKAQMAILGTGESRFEDALADLANQFPESIAVRLAFSDPMSRMIEGGSDFFLMPSRYEPCGLNQMYSLRYGTLPVVRKTGGLADTVIDLNSNPGKGNGFVFEEATGDALADAVHRAVVFFSRTNAMMKARNRGMKKRFDWKSSAKRYVEVFRRGMKN